MELSEEARLQRARTFDQIADLYDRARREPPGWLYDTVFAESRLETATVRVLEIGCGTGKSTLPMARRGARILALEMGANLARLAQHHLASFPKVDVLCTRFEDWRPMERFDLVLAITAWHWLDPAVRYGHAAAALRPGGTLAFTVTEHAYPPGTIPSSKRFRSATERSAWGRSRGRLRRPTLFRIPGARSSRPGALRMCADPEVVGGRVYRRGACRVDRGSLVIEKRGTPKAVLLSIRDYVKLASPEPEPEVLRILGEDLKRNGTNKMTQRQIDQEIKAYRAQKKKR